MKIILLISTLFLISCSETFKLQQLKSNCSIAKKDMTQLDVKVFPEHISKLKEECDKQGWW